jgi:Ion transport protein
MGVKSDSGHIGLLLPNGGGVAVFIFAILGMQLFGGRFDFPDEGGVPRHHYNDFIWAFITTFRVITRARLCPVASLPSNRPPPPNPKSRPRLRTSFELRWYRYHCSVL